MIIPKDVEYIIDNLYGAGYEAYIVGGCVRDFFLGQKPHDWDLATDARPEAVKQIFSHLKIIDTGLKYGTVTIIIKGVCFEVTTYRTEGKYIMNRKPENITFVKSLKDDLKRRDFTVNSMAYNKKYGLKDYFGGKDDLKLGIIKCVGNPDERLSEDALRIMRALRLASEKEFEIEYSTYKSMCKNSNLLKNISVERITSELNRTLMGKAVYKSLKNYSQPLFDIIPELKARYRFDNTMETIKNSVPDLEIRLALLLHNHLCPQKVRVVMKRLKYDSFTIENVFILVNNYNLDIIPTEKNVMTNLSKFGEVLFSKILRMKYAYASVISPYVLSKNIENIEQSQRIIEHIIASGKCYSLECLAINGMDLKKIGIPEGKIIGQILEKILELVIKGDIKNEKEIIIKKIRNEENFIS